MTFVRVLGNPNGSARLGRELESGGHPRSSMVFDQSPCLAAFVIGTCTWDLGVQHFFASISSNVHRETPDANLTGMFLRVSERNIAYMNVKVASGCYAVSDASRPAEGRFRRMGNDKRLACAPIGHFGGRSHQSVRDAQRALDKTRANYRDAPFVKHNRRAYGMPARSVGGVERRTLLAIKAVPQLSCGGMTW